MPSPLTFDGRRLPASYANFYMTTDELGPNLSNYLNPEVNELFEQARVTVDFDARMAIYEQIEAEGRGHLIDAISPAGYMGYESEEIAALGASATGQDVVSSAHAFSFDENEYAMQGWRGHAALAAGEAVDPGRDGGRPEAGRAEA